MRTTTYSELSNKSLLRWVKIIKKNKVCYTLIGELRKLKIIKSHLLINKYLKENADKVLLNETTTNRLNGRNSTGSTNCTVIDSFETIEEIGSICGVRMNYFTTITLSFCKSKYFGLVQIVLYLSKVFWSHHERFIYVAGMS